jgi:hypothetical protein
MPMRTGLKWRKTPSALAELDEAWSQDREASAEGDDWKPSVAGGEEVVGQVQSVSFLFVLCKPKHQKSEATSDD